MNSMIKSTLFIILCLVFAASSAKLNLKKSKGKKCCYLTEFNTFPRKWYPGTVDSDWMCSTSDGYSTYLWSWPGAVSC